MPGYAGIVLLTIALVMIVMWFFVVPVTQALFGKIKKTNKKITIGRED